MVAVAVAVCPGMRGHLGARTLQVGRDPSNGPTSCLHAPTASQAGRRRFDPGRPLSLRAVTRQGFFVWPPPSRAVAAAISQSRKCPDDADLSIEKYEICESARRKVATACAT